jgi:hypothetical protein
MITGDSFRAACHFVVDEMTPWQNFNKQSFNQRSDDDGVAAVFVQADHLPSFFEKIAPLLRKP